MGAEKRRRIRQKQGSFTLIETTIALSILSFVILEVAGSMGGAVTFSDYNRNVTKATFLARRLASQVQYYYHTKPFSDLDRVNVKEAAFENVDDYKYSLSIKEWKFPLEKVLTGDFSGAGEDEEDDSDSPMEGNSDLVSQAVKQVFGDEPQFLIAYIEVFWPEGAQKNSTTLTYLLTNQTKLDQAVFAMKATYDKANKPQTDNKNKNKNKNNNDKPDTGTADDQN